MLFFSVPQKLAFTRHLHPITIYVNLPSVFWTLPSLLYVLVLVPAGRLAGTHTAAVSGAVGPFGVAKCSPDAVDGEELHEQRPRYSEPENRHKYYLYGTQSTSFVIG